MEWPGASEVREWERGTGRPEKAKFDIVFEGESISG